VLFIGDSRLLPVPSTEYRDGVSWAIMNDGALDARDRWMSPSNEAADLITSALDEVSAASTLRAGRLLAPLGIRYVVVPEFDGVVSTVNDPLPLPVGLISSLEDQLDLVAIEPRLPTLEVFENRSWLPTASLLEGSTAAASTSAGPEVLARSDLGEASPVFVGADQFGSSSDDLVPGVVHLGIPYDDNWSLSVDGIGLDSRRAFGETTAFDVPRPGVGELRYDTPLTRPLMILLQVALWIVALVIVSRVRVPVSRRSRALVTNETLIDLSDPAVAVVPTGEPVTGETESTDVDLSGSGDGVER
jgi:hypothetical protein